ncbi:hypothetical protein GE061_010767 [Apolygus lucorum]|uniref:Uncharacterized protein n=1 Tax=Apolygus lucorum TaxID=248454 RepID=A0A6A4JZF6_APOLU|nr:hypothetical protein GE061_010767 [Apolygus lucorum]
MGKKSHRKSRRDRSTSSSSESRRSLVKRLEKLEKELLRRTRSRSRSRLDRKRSDRQKDRSLHRRVTKGVSPSTSARERVQSGPSAMLPRDTSDSDRSPSRTRNHRNDSLDESCSVRSGDQTPRGQTPNNNEDRFPSEMASLKGRDDELVEGGTIDLECPNDIPEDIRRILGDDPAEPKENIYTLNDLIVSRWKKVLELGITKEELSNLTAKFEAPSNLTALHPPKLNPEVLPALQKIHSIRDNCYFEMQKQLGKQYDNESWKESSQYWNHEESRSHCNGHKKKRTGPLALPPGFDKHGASLQVLDTPEVTAEISKHFLLYSHAAALPVLVGN